MQLYSDEYIEHWADVYLENELSKYDVYFEAFLLEPQAILDSVISNKKFNDALDELETIFEKEYCNDAEAMQEEMDSQFERKGHVIEMQGNKTIERFHHHDPSKKWKTNSRAKAGGAS